MKKNLTELVFIVDRSGSMGGLESDTVGGINATLAKNRKVEGEANVSIVLFDNTSEVLVDRVPIEKVKDLTLDDYQVRGCTALLDAVGDSIRHIGRVQCYMPASQRHTYDDVKRAIGQRTEEGWEFVFLGANIDAVGEAARIGIQEDRAATYIADEVGSSVMFKGVADACCEIRSASVGGRIGSAWKSAIERDAAKRG